VFTDGPEVGIRVVAAAERAGALPAALTATVRQRWVHRLADGMDAAAVGGGRRDRCAAFAPGRYLDATSGLEAHIAVPAEGWPDAVAAVAAGWPGAAPHRATTIRAMPVEVDLAQLPVGSVPPKRPWRLTIGIDEDDQPAELVLHEGDHVLVAGPGRSGRTTALATVAGAVRRAHPTATVVALAGRRSWLGGLRGVLTVADVTSAVDAVACALAPPPGTPRLASPDGAGPDDLPQPTFLLVDDADTVDDVGGALEALLAIGGVHVVAAARAEVARGLYQHWLRPVRRSRLGVLLRPNADLDGELLGAVLPRRSAAPWVDGRGYLVVDGTPTLVQLARCKDASP
jgi:S-DNA-T family DNA segregation ATPase FtsK/SpoIIIE